jgi:putative transposase
MTSNSAIRHRRSIRVRNYDYSHAGAYFITICAWNKESLFGEIEKGQMQLNAYGEIAIKYWNGIHGHFMHVETDEFIVMPNHVHGVIVVNNCRGEVTSPFSSGLDTMKSIIQGGETPPLRRFALGQIVAYFKYQTAKQINQIRNTPGTPVWQRNYYEHIIRSEKDLKSIREYIRYNPLKWDEDEENPAMKVTIRRNA